MSANPYRRAALAEHALAIGATIAMHMPREATAEKLATALASWTPEQRMGTAKAAGLDVDADVLASVWLLVVGAFRGGVRAQSRAA